MTSRIGERRKQAQSEPSAEYTSKRRAIIDAAARVFQRVGYERASMSDVGAEAGADRASVYYYFKGKQEIFHAVIIDAVEALIAQAEAIAGSDADPEDQVRELVGAVMQAYIDHYPYLYVYVQEDMRRLDEESESSKTLRQLARRFGASFEEVIAHGIASGAFKPDLDARLTSYAILGALNWTHRWYTPDQGLEPAEVTAVFVETFLHGMSARPKRRASRPRRD